MSSITIEIGGKERTLKFNQLAIETIFKYYTDESNTANVYAMFYAGLNGNSYVKQEAVDYNFENVCDWVDELKDANKLDVIEAVEKCMLETQTFKKLLALNKPEDKKKVKKLKA